MRATFNPDFVSDGEKLTGFYFNNGGCAEHEFGIKELEERFGIDRTKLGHEGRMITRSSGNYIYFKYKSLKKNRACLLSVSPWRYRSLDMTDKKAVRKFVETFPFKVRPYIDEEKDWISAAWDRDEFGIYVTGEENIGHLDKIVEALEKNDLAIFVGNPTPNNPFSRGGLVLMIVSAVSDEIKKNMYNIDYDAQKLEQAAAPYIKKVRDAGLKYHALAPQWASSLKRGVVFWLNPYDQQNNYFGWVTVKDLKDWIKGKGVIPGHGYVFEKSHPEEYKAIVEKQRKIIFGE